VLPEWVYPLISAFAGLGGVMLAGSLQQRASREAYQREQVGHALDLVAAMMTALDDHRSAMWALRDRYHRGQRRRSSVLARLLSRWLLGKHLTSWQGPGEELARTHRTRTAISGPQTLLHALDGRLGAAADAAADATYAMLRSTDLDDLEDRQLAARDAARQFRTTALKLLRPAGNNPVSPQAKRGRKNKVLLGSRGS
jgi:hypothetical protein